MSNFFRSEVQMISHYRHRPLLYFTMTFLANFALWFAGAYVSSQADKSGLYMVFMLPGLMAPFLISLGMIFTSKDSDIKKDFRICTHLAFAPSCCRF